ncbi:hypothetical protein EX30DRAFT_344575 [Ascodesmis nigricans]|uniref:Uncharacterized protein n=1 Tax=Ascodesmis nigricans TaxID=341454 RepID=A0A4S2MIT6_9PEZI|nr:hypothetical protein EX30DRAFT_344575 [Ascodesmis nigricans]
MHFTSDPGRIYFPIHDASPPPSPSISHNHHNTNRSERRGVADIARAFKFIAHLRLPHIAISRRDRNFTPQEVERDEAIRVVRNTHSRTGYEGSARKRGASLGGRHDGSRLEIEERLEELRVAIPKGYRVKRDTQGARRSGGVREEREYLPDDASEVTMVSSRNNEMTIVW